MRTCKYLLLSILVISSFIFGQKKRDKDNSFYRNTKVERLIGSDKMLSGRIRKMENEIKQLRDKQVELRKEINNEIDNEIEKTIKEKQKLENRSKEIKTKEDKKLQQSIERNEVRIQSLKKLKTELNN